MKRLIAIVLIVILIFSALVWLAVADGLTPPHTSAAPVGEEQALCTWCRRCLDTRSQTASGLYTDVLPSYLREAVERMDTDFERVAGESR